MAQQNPVVVAGQPADWPTTPIKNLPLAAGGGSVVVSGTVTTTLTDPAEGAPGSPVPSEAIFTGGKDQAGNLQGVLVESNTNPNLRVGIYSGSTEATVTGANALKVDGSAVTQPVLAASLPLPTGASTSAKQPALGTAGSASSDVITIQGIASMTAVKVDGSGVVQPVSGTVTTNPPANASTNITQIGGSAITEGQKTSSASVPVVIASDQSAVTVSGTITTTPPSNASTNVTQFGGNPVVTGTGTGGAGIPRVTVSSDSFPSVQPVSGTVATIAADGAVVTLGSTTDVPSYGFTGTVEAKLGAMADLLQSLLAAQTQTNLILSQPVISAPVTGDIQFVGGIPVSGGILPTQLPPQPLLNTTDFTDVTASTPTRGAVINVPSSGKWTSLTLGGNGTVFNSNGTDSGWGTVIGSAANPLSVTANNYAAPTGGIFTVPVGLVADSVTDNSAAINNAITKANTAGGGIVYIPCGNYAVTTAINLTNTGNVKLQGCGRGLFNTDTTDAANSSNSTTIRCLVSTVCIDTTGSSYMTISDMNIGSNPAYGPNVSPAIILQGRDNASPGNFCFSQFNVFKNLSVYAFHNQAANSGIGTTAIYNVGGEEATYDNVITTSDTGYYFGTASDFGVTSVYQTLQTGCPASMAETKILGGAIRFTATGSPSIGAGIIAHNTNSFYVSPDTQLGASNGGTGYAVYFGGATNNQWLLYGQAENQTAPGSLIALAAGCSLDHVVIDMLTSSQSGSTQYWTTLTGGQTITNSKIRVAVPNGTVQPMFNNLSLTWKGGEIDLGTTATGTSWGNITLSSGTIVNADGFTDSQVTFNSASQYVLLDTTGSSLFGPVRFTGTASFTTSSFTLPGTVANDTAGGMKICNNGAQCIQLSSLGSIFTPGNITLHSSGALQFGASEDSGISRTAASTLAVGNGTATDKSGTLLAAHIGNSANPVSDISIGTAATNNAIFSPDAMTAARTVRLVDAPMGIPQPAFVTANVTNSTTSMANVTGLSWPLVANRQYYLSCDLIYQAAATGGLQLAFTGPASPTQVEYCVQEAISTSTFAGDSCTAAANTSFATKVGAGVVSTANTNLPARFYGTIENGANAGTLQIQFASAAAVATIVERGSACTLTAIN